MKKIYFSLLLIFLLDQVRAQGNIQDLKIGDRLPDLVLKNILGKDDPVNISALHQHDLLIINFWATWCVPCMHELPLLDSISAENPDHITVLCVAYETAAKVKAILKLHPEIVTSHMKI